jgi:predicted aspartyl protease
LRAQATAKDGGALRYDGSPYPLGFIMRFSIAVSLSVLVCSAGEAQTPSVRPLPALQSESPEQNTAEEAPLFASPSSQDRAGRIVAPVMINGRGPFRFVVDTGANTSVLSPALAKELGLELSVESGIVVSGVTGRTVVGSVPIATLEVGALKMSNLNLPVIGSALAGVDGILGVDGFADLRLTVDFGNDTVKIDRSDNKRAARGYTVLPARFRHGRLLTVASKVGSVSADAVIDTGAEGTLGNTRLQQVLHRRLVQKNRGDNKASIEGVTADIQYGDVLGAAKIYFDGMEIEGIDIAYGDFHVFDLWDYRDRPALLIGMNVLGTADVLIIDYRRREVQIKPRTKGFLRRARE